MVKVGFIGLGRMGRGMALNLVKAGKRPIVFDANTEAVGALAKAGASAARNIAELACDADVIFMSLPGPVQVNEVVLGPDGILDNFTAGTALFDLSTNSVAVVRALGAKVAERGAHFLDAPVSGGPAGAASGDLVLWIGGDKTAFDQHIDLLRVIGKSPLHVGPIGAGTVTKLAHNVLGYTIMLAQSEIFSLAAKAGVEPLELWCALRFGMVGKGSPLDMLTKQFLPGSYDTPAFALKLALKDVTLATELGRELGVPLRLCSLTHAEMAEAVAKGMGDKDSRAFLQLQLERAGVRIAVDPDRLQQAVAAVGT